MARNPTMMRNLTMASAQHLLSQGHISPKLHANIMKKAKRPKASPPGLSDRDGDEAGAPFGSLNAGGGAGHYMATSQEEE